MGVVLVNGNLHILAKYPDCLEPWCLGRDINGYFPTDCHHAEMIVFLLQVFTVYSLAGSIVF